jgi:hypothetical protein
MAPLLRCRSSRDGSPASHASPASPPVWPFVAHESAYGLAAVEFRILGPTRSVSKSGAEFFRHQTGCPRATASTRRPRLSGSDSQES